MTVLFSGEFWSRHFSVRSNPVQDLVAFPTKRDQVGLCVVTKSAAPSDVVNIEVPGASTFLAALTIAFQDFPSQPHILPTLNVANTRETLQNIIHLQDKRVTIKMIQKRVGEHFGVFPPDLKLRNSSKATRTQLGSSTEPVYSSNLKFRKLTRRITFAIEDHLSREERRAVASC
jgi:hypothetical protein